jgi:hypothetical protein
MNTTLNDLMGKQITEYPSERAVEMLERIHKLDYACHHGQATPDLMFPIKELNSSELAWTNFGNHEPQFIGYASLPYIDKNGKSVGGFGFAGCHFVIYWDGTAIAWNREWKYTNHSLTKKQHPEPKGGMWKNGKSKNNMVVRFYLLGCQHKYQEVSGKSIRQTLFRMEHANKCKKCGHTYVTDSSD